MEKTASKKISHILPATAAFAALFAYAAALTMPQSSVNQMGREFGVTNSALGGLFSFFMIGFLVAAVAGGRLSDRLGKLPMIVIGCSLMAAGMLVFAKSPTFGLLPYAALLAGLGGGLAEVVATALIADLYHGPQRTAMMNWTQVVFSAGAVTQPLIFARLLSMGMDWRMGYMAAAILSILCAPIAASAFATIRKTTATAPKQELDWSKIIQSRFVLRLSAALMLYVGAEMGLASWVAAFLERDLGAAAPTAASAVAVFWVGIGFGRVAAARATRYLSDQALICWGFGLGAAMQSALLFTRSPETALVMIFLAGFFLGPVWPTIISRAGGAFPSNSGAVIGIVAAAGCTGAAIIPRLIGWISDTTGLRPALWICVVCLILGLGMMNIRSRWRTESPVAEAVKEHV